MPWHFPLDYVRFYPALFEGGVRYRASQVGNLATSIVAMRQAPTLGIGIFLVLETISVGKLSTGGCFVARFCRK